MPPSSIRAPVPIGIEALRELFSFLFAPREMLEAGKVVRVEVLRIAGHSRGLGVVVFGLFFVFGETLRTSAGAVPLRLVVSSMKPA